MIIEEKSSRNQEKIMTPAKNHGRWTNPTSPTKSWYYWGKVWPVTMSLWGKQFSYMSSLFTAETHEKWTGHRTLLLLSFLLLWGVLTAGCQLVILPFSSPVKHAPYIHFLLFYHIQEFVTPWSYCLCMTKMWLSALHGIWGQVSMWK